jgi:hypothetical protein
MSERKGHGNRGSLMELSKPRLAHTPLSTPIDEAERLILTPETKPAGTIAADVPTVESVGEGRGSPTPEAGRTPPPPEPSNSFHPGEIRHIRNREQKRIPSTDDVLARLRKIRQPIAVVGFKLPARLKEELAIVAQHNGTDMTRIVVEALERFLLELPHPPDWDR